MIVSEEGGRHRPEPTRIVVVVPVCNEEQLLPRCLRALRRSADAVAIPVRIQLVLNGCTDGSARVAGPDIEVVTLDEPNVGMARGLGFAAAGAGCGRETWFATTDADSAVDQWWLRRQLRHARRGADIVAGVVRVDDWSASTPVARARYEQRYRRPQGDGHGHVHGANLGFRADTYWDAGGFDALATGEDVDLVERATARGAHLVWAEDVVVTTSGRTEGRAPDGFAAHVRALDQVSEADSA
ncbi:glycosyltransferase [Nocardia sp. NPDC048505]|uniref:glycosyltransferase n=1 Tax=Nocardia sp. NPDC048505 TaxID=3155756 RepID=UPI0033E3851B